MIAEISYEIRSAGDLIMDTADTLKEARRIRDLYKGETPREYFIYRVEKLPVLEKELIDFQNRIAEKEKEECK